MSETVQREIRDLRALFWSDRDPGGRGFAPLADAYRRAGELSEAEELLADGLDRHPDFSSGHVVAAWVARERGDLEGARGSFERVLELDPENVVALRELGRILEEEGRDEEALDCYRRLQELEPGNTELARRIAGLGGEAPAGEEGGAVHELPEEDRELELAGAAAELTGAAGEREDEPREKDDEGDVYTATMAEIYVRQGLYQRAVGVYERLLDADPENESFRERLAEVRELAEGGVRAGETAREEAWDEPEDLPEAEEPGGEADDEVEVLAGEAAGTPSEDLETPFAWSEEEELEEGEAPSGSEADGESVGTYFEGLLAWVPGAVPVESLAPDATDAQIEPVEEVAPEVSAEAPVVEEEEVEEGVEAGAEEAETELVEEAPGPDAVPMDALAPEEVAAEPAEAPAEDQVVDAVPIETLAPEPADAEAEAVEESRAPEPRTAPVEAPGAEEEDEAQEEDEGEFDASLSDVLSQIDALGEGEEEEETGDEDEDLDDFQKWLDSMGE